MTTKKQKYTKYAPIVETDETVVKEAVKESHLERRFRSIWNVVAADLPIVPQKKNVVPGRRYAYDFCQEETMVLFEIQGGIYAKGKSGHSSGTGIMRDADKVNLGQINGYNTFVITPEKLTVEYLSMVARYVRTKRDSIASSNQGSHS